MLIQAFSKFWNLFKILEFGNNLIQSPL